jgi:3-phenylpropionate/trans-cinnamate dioxygenase ferredoxin reductase subunit
VERYSTRAPAKGFIWIIFSVVWLFLLLYIRVFKPWALLRRPYRVKSVRPERGDSWTVTVEPASSDSPLAFHPGQFAWLTLGLSPFRAREHPFSFSGSAEDRSVLQFTIKELGDFTRIVKFINPGEVAYVDGPHGVFTSDLYPDAPGFGFIAGGVGIAPIMSMLRTLADRREQRPLLLIYGNSNWERVLFREEIDSLAQSLNLKLVHVLQDPPPEWAGLSGILSADVLKQSIGKEATDFVFFACGPKGMIHSAQRALRELGVPLRRVNYEHFEMVVADALNVADGEHHRSRRHDSVPDSPPIVFDSKLLATITPE